MANTSSVDDSPALSDITKFNGTNYKRWSCQVRAKLMGIGAWRIATGDLKAPGKNASEKEHRTFDDLNDRGYSIIYFSLEEQYQTDLDDMDSCYGAWNLLKFYDENTEENSFQMVPDLLVDLPDPDKTEELLEKWQGGRRGTIKDMKEILENLRDLSKTVHMGQTGAASSRIFGNALSLTGAAVEIFYPQATNVTTPLKAWGNGFDLFGRFASPILCLSEIGISMYLINKVDDALKEDKKKSEELEGKLRKMAESDQRIRNDYGISLIEFFLRRGGKIKKPNSENQTKINNKKNLLGLSYKLLRSFSADRYVGDKALYYCGVSELYRKFSLDAVVLVLDVYDLMKSVGIEEAAYVTYVENCIKRLEMELEMSFPKQE